MTQPETRLQRAIQREVRERGGFVFKVHGSEFMMAGLPDLIVCYYGLYVAFECKMPGNKPTPIQEHRCRQIHEAGGLAHVVYSVDEVKEVLDEIDREIQLHEFESRWADTNRSRFRSQ